MESLKGGMWKGYWFAYPVVAETYDGVLHDINGQHIRQEHVFEALNSAQSGLVQEGSVGGGTGMTAHGFKAGTGTSSRVITNQLGRFTVGVLVQANYGSREHMRLAGVPIDRALKEIPLPKWPEPSGTEKPNPSDDGSGSIIVVAATDAPLNALQCRRLAQRASIGIARMGGHGENGSGDLFLAFATGNPGAFSRSEVTQVRQFPNESMTALFVACHKRQKKPSAIHW